MTRRDDELTVFDEGVQHERTSMAWERTAFSLIISGALMGRYASNDGLWPFTVLGLCIALGGIVLVLWSGRNYESLHGLLEAGESPVHQGVARVVGLGATFTAVGALLFGIVVALARVG